MLMKRKVRISKPCMDCGGSVPHMNTGGVNPMEAQQQAPVKESAVGMCTGTNFGGPGCPKGSQQYEIALKFRKEEALQKKKEIDSVAEQGANIDSVTGKRNAAFKDHIARNTTNVMAEEEMIRAITQPQHQMPDGTMMPGAQHISQYGGVPEFVVGGNMGPQTQQEWNDSNKFGQAKFDQQFGIPMEKITPKPVVTDVEAIIDAGQFGDQSGQQGLANDTDLAKTTVKRKSGLLNNLKNAFGPNGLALDAIAQFGENRTEPDFAAMMDATTHADQAFTSSRDVDRGAIGFNDFGLARGADDFGVAQFKGTAPRNISKYGGVPKFEYAGQPNFGYKGNEQTNMLIKAQQEKEQGNQIWGQMADNFANADLSDQWKTKTKVIDNDPNDGIDTKGWYKDYNKAYKKNYNNSMDNNMFANMFAKMMMGGQNLPQRAPGGPGQDIPWYAAGWAADKEMLGNLFGYDNSMEQRRINAANTPEATRVSNPGRYNTPVVHDAAYDENMAAAAERKEHEDLIARTTAERDANVSATERKRQLFNIARQQKAANAPEGADAIEEARQQRNTNSDSRSTTTSEKDAAETTTAKEEAVTEGNYTPPEETTEGETVTDPHGNVTFVQPNRGQAPIATDYNYLSKINMRANPFRRKGHQRVKSYEFTHGIRGNGQPAAPTDGGGAGGFDPNNITPEEMTMLTNMMNAKKSEANAVDATTDNTMNYEDAMAQQYAGMPQIDKNGFPIAQPAPDDISNLSGQSTGDYADYKRYGGDNMYAVGGPEGGYGTPGYGVPDVTPQAAPVAPWFVQDQATMADAMRNRPMNGPSNVERAELMTPRPTIGAEPTDIAKREYMDKLNEFENRQRANMFAPTKQYGGDAMFQEGGEYDMTPDQVAAFLQAGGQIEYI